MFEPNDDGVRMFKALCLLAFVTTVGIMLLAGCAGQWQRPGATAADFARESAACALEAEKAVAAVENAVAAGIREASITSSCLKAKGWSR